MLSDAIRVGGGWEGLGASWAGGAKGYLGFQTGVKGGSLRLRPVFWGGADALYLTLPKTDFLVCVQYTL